MGDRKKESINKSLVYGAQESFFIGFMVLKS